MASEPVKRGALLNASPALHAGALTATCAATGIMSYLGSSWGYPAWLAGLALAALIPITVGVALHGMGKPSEPFLQGAGKRYVNDRAGTLLAKAAALGIGLILLRFAPTPAVAALLSAGLVAPAGYFLPYGWGSSLLALTDVEAAYLLRGRILWRAPLGSESWIKMDNTGGKRAVSFVAFGTRAREFGRVVDHDDLARPQFVELVRDLRELARRRAELYVVDRLDGLKTDAPPVEPAVTRTSLNRPADHEPLEYRMPPP